MVKNGIITKLEEGEPTPWVNSLVYCSQGGILPDPNIISALKQMSAPTSRQELQTFLGLANYMGPFIPNLSTLTAPLRELLKESHQFDWSPAHQEAYNKIKDSISSEVTLTYFDPTKDITWQVDASLISLLLLRALTDMETRYTNIELLAVVYGYEKFHTNLYSHSFTANTDFKPLESIHLKHLTVAPLRLQGMLLRLQRFDLVISRLSPEEKEAIPGMNVQVHDIHRQFSNSILERIREQNALKEMILSGWPLTIRQVSVLILALSWWARCRRWDRHMKSHRIIIPTVLQKENLDKALYSTPRNRDDKAQG